MVARAVPFRQADVARAVKGAKAAGMAVGRVEIDPNGRIVLVAAGEAQEEPSSDYDKWKAQRHARSA